MAERQNVVVRLWEAGVRHISGQYTAIEKQQINKIIELYKNFFNITNDEQLPEIWKLGEDYSNRIQISTETFRILYWEPRIEGSFQDEIKELVIQACIYQELRSARNGGYLDDPINLFLHYFKEDITSLAKTDFDNSDLNKLLNWSKLLRGLYRSNVFPAGNGHEITMFMTLHKLESMLETQTIEVFKLEQRNASAYQKINLIIKHLYKVFDYSVSFLFYIFRDTENTPNNISIRQLLNPTYNQLKAAMKNKSAQLLKQVLNSSYSISDIQIKTYNTQEPIFEIQYDLDTQIKSLSIDYEHTYFDTQKIINLRNEICDKKNNKNAGIASVFCEEHIVNKFLVAHKFLIETAKICRNFIFARECAKKGGDLLLLGLTRDVLKNDIEQSCEMLVYIEKLYKELYSIAKLKETELAQDNNNAKNNQWVSNFYIADEYKQLTDRHIASCKDYLGQLQSMITSTTPENYIEETKKARENYILFHKQQLPIRTDFLKKLRQNKMEQVLFDEPQIIVQIDSNVKSPGKKLNNNLEDKSLVHEPDNYNLGFKPTSLKKEIKNINSNKITDKQFDVKSYFHKAKELFDTEDYKEALRYFLDLAELQPRSPAIHLYCALIYEKLNFDEYALVSLNEVLKLNPKHKEGLYYRCVLYFKLEYYDEALENINDYLREYSGGNQESNEDKINNQKLIVRRDFIVAKKNSEFQLKYDSDFTVDNKL